MSRPSRLLELRAHGTPKSAITSISSSVTGCRDNAIPSTIGEMAEQCVYCDDSGYSNTCLHKYKSINSFIY